MGSGIRAPAPRNRSGGVLAAIVESLRDQNSFVEASRSGRAPRSSSQAPPQCQRSGVQPLGPGKRESLATGGRATCAAQRRAPRDARNPCAGGRPWRRSSQGQEDKVVPSPRTSRPAAGSAYARDATMRQIRRSRCAPPSAVPQTGAAGSVAESCRSRVPHSRARRHRGLGPSTRARAGPRAAASVSGLPTAPRTARPAARRRSGRRRASRPRSRHASWSSLRTAAGTEAGAHSSLPSDIERPRV